MEPTKITRMADQMRALSKQHRIIIYHRALKKIAICILVIDVWPTIQTSSLATTVAIGCSKFLNSCRLIIQLHEAVEPFR